MRIFKLTQTVDSSFLDTIKPQSLRGLAAEALKSPTFREFEHNLGATLHEQNKRASLESSLGTNL